MRDRILIILIILFSSTYVYLNVDKLEYAYKKTFVTPQRLTSNEQSKIINVKVTHSGETIRTSLIRGSVTSAQGRSVLFVHVPEAFDLRDVYVDINEQQYTKLEHIDGAVSYIDTPSERLYFIRSNHAQNLVDILSVNDLVVSQP